jgi:aminopeptidase N
LILQAVDLELLEIAIDGRVLAESQWRLQHGQLSIHELPAKSFELVTCCRLRPADNTSLEGLYLSGGMFATQCEAEGFRRITPFLDRPDVLSCYRVRIEASEAEAPVLLSNGNRMAAGQLPEGRHFVEWQDPFPKPCYLFALVAGRLQAVEDSFSCRSGRNVQLFIHVEPGDECLCDHAMASLKRCMAWDEQVYGLEYDLDAFHIVAVRHFNMGAMENKGLNIFNSKLVLADAETASDSELERIESVIAHEYFHNWTGNRVTCRDWFQLSLKEGLTVFRDQEFSADLHGKAIKRIADVAMLRAHQFPEDAGPTAHPVQPNEYIAIDNFYTTTIYEKGAELIRMQRTLLGERAFMAGVQLYLRRHDGEAATCDQFVAALEDASGRSLTAFRRWYHQAGTPRLRVERHWDGANGVLELVLSQHHDPSPGQPEKQPLPIPVAMGLLAPAGEPLREQLLLLEQQQQSWRFEGLPGGSPPVLSLLRGFSAPVRLELERSIEELEVLFAADPDPFSRWDAGQQLWKHWLMAPTAELGSVELEAGLLRACRSLLQGFAGGDWRLVWELLQAPASEELEAAFVQSGFVPDPLGIERALLRRRSWLGAALAAELKELLRQLEAAQQHSWPVGVGERQLIGLAWNWLAAAGDQQARQAAEAAVLGASMTMAKAGLAALQPWDCLERNRALEHFQKRWQGRPVILDAWFALEAATPFGDGIARAEQLLQHPCFDPQAPNCLRAVLGGFARCAQSFHNPDGSGYRWLAQQLLDLDGRNPITASRFLKLYMGWRRYDNQRQQQMLAALTWLAERLQSANSLEVVERCLAA